MNLISSVIKDQLQLHSPKEEREAKTAKVYLGNVKVVWTNGDNVAAAPRDGQQAPAQSLAPQPDDLPF